MQLCAVRDDAHEHLPALFAAAHVKVAQNAAVRRFIVDALPTQFLPRAERFRRAIKYLGLQKAGVRVDDTVGIHGVKAHLHFAVFGKPDGQLAFVAVARAGRRAEDRLHGDIFKAADALQGVADTLRFDLQLRFIRDVAVNAAAARACNGTIRCGAIGRRRKQLLEPPECVLFEDFYDAHDAAVAHGGTGHEHGHAICAADAAALGGHGGDLRFKQIIFLYHGKTSVKHKILFFMHKAENMRVI